MKNKFLVSLLVLVIITGTITYLGWEREPTAQDQEKVQVVASFYPLAEFTRQVGGDFVDVSTVVAAGLEPHEYEPTPQQLAMIYNASLFIYNGSGFDPWAERIAAELEQSGVRVLNMSEVITTQALAIPGDPHFWLDPSLAQEQVEVITTALIAIDSDHAPQYQARSQTYKELLQQLDLEYQAGLATCAQRELITSHNAFTYLAKRYNLSFTSIAGLSPEAEPSARALGELTKLAREKNINYIFFETLASPRLAQTLAAEIGAQTLVFDPIEGIAPSDLRAGKNYLSVMRANLQNLRTALECSS